MGRLKWLTVAESIGGHLHVPTVSVPSLAGVLRRLDRPQHPGDDAALAVLVICCHDRDLAFPFGLAADLAV